MYSQRVYDIIRELNRLNAEENDTQYGVTDLDVALEIRADGWDGDGECPPPTPEEIDAINAEVERLIQIDAEKDELFAEYYSITGDTPYRYECGGDYAIRWPRN